MRVVPPADEASEPAPPQSSAFEIDVRSRKLDTLCAAGDMPLLNVPGVARVL